MKILYYFSHVGFANTYIINDEKSASAILIDPGEFTMELLNLINEHQLSIDHVLLTHAHPSHYRGLKTLLKIFDAKVYGREAIPFAGMQKLSHGERLQIAGLDVEILDIGGHSPHSLVYRIEDALFTGDTLMPGRIAKAPTPLLMQKLRTQIEEELFSKLGPMLVFAGHGAPTTLGIERRFNPEVRVPTGHID